MAGVFSYARISRLMSKEPGKRPPDQLALLDVWFKKKSKLLAACDQETLLDVIQHCDFVTRNKDDVIILQGEKGHRFFIILRGSVSVLLKDSLEDVELGEEKLEARQIDRANLGNAVVTLDEGSTFGELALIHPDCVRTASILADEKTDLVVIHRDLYNRSVSKVIARDYAEKMNFIDSVPLLRAWPQKIKRQLAVSFRKEVYNFDSCIVKQGDPIKDLYFIAKGEVKLTVDPEAHYLQYDRFMSRSSTLLEEDESVTKTESAYFPQKLLPQLQKYTRISKTSVMNHGGPGYTGGHTQPSFPLAWSPSAIRKMNVEMNSKRCHVNLCFLGERQMLGDVELLLGLPTSHVTAGCSQETSVMALHRNHFERLFRKKNPASIRELTKTVETQLALRCLKSNLLETVPIMRVMLFRLQESIGSQRAGDEKRFISTLRTRAKQAESTHGQLHAVKRQRTQTSSHTTISSLPDGLGTNAFPDDMQPTRSKTLSF